MVDYSSLGQKYAHLASPFELVVTEQGFSVKFTMVYHPGPTDPPGTKTYHASYSIDESMIAQSELYVESMVRNLIVELRKSLRHSISSERDYAEVRLWAAEAGMDWALTVKNLPTDLINRYKKENNPIGRGQYILKVETDSAVEAIRDVKETIEDMARIPRVTPPVRKPKRIPQCPVHEVDFVFDTEDNEWVCTQPRKNGKPGQQCNLRKKPAQTQDNGLTMGSGQIRLHVVFLSPGNEPRLVLVAANNVAIDITDTISEYSDINGWGDLRRAIRIARDSKIDQASEDSMLLVLPVTLTGVQIVGAGSNG